MMTPPNDESAPVRAPLSLPRRLAIRILHEAQQALPDSIDGWVYADEGGTPCDYRSALADMGVHKADQVLWARLWSEPVAPGEPPAEALRPHILNLVVSLSTRGVLEIRAWELLDQTPQERMLRIVD